VLPISILSTILHLRSARYGGDSIGKSRRVRYRGRARGRRGMVMGEPEECVAIACAAIAEEFLAFVLCFVEKVQAMSQLIYRLVG